MPRLRSLLSICLLSFFALTARAAERPAVFELRDGDRVAFIGDRLIEGEQYEGWLEVMLTTRFADRAITFRNLGWSGDTPAGDARFGLSLLQAGREPADEGWRGLVKQIEDAKPTVVFLGYGMASSFDGAAGVAKFKADYNRLLDTIEQASPGARIVLLSPLRHESPFATTRDADMRGFHDWLWSQNYHRRRCLLRKPLEAVPGIRRDAP